MVASAKHDKTRPCLKLHRLHLQPIAEDSLVSSHKYFHVVKVPQPLALQGLERAITDDITIDNPEHSGNQQFGI